MLLHLASEHGSIEVCEALLNKNAFVNSKTKTGWTSLHYASMKGYTTLVEFLIKKHNATIDSLTMVSLKLFYLVCMFAVQESLYFFIHEGRSKNQFLFYNSLSLLIANVFGIRI